MRIEMYGHVPCVEIGKWRNITMPSPPAGNEIQIKQLRPSSDAELSFYEPN